MFDIQSQIEKLKSLYISKKSIYKNKDLLEVYNAIKTDESVILKTEKEKKKCKAQEWKINQHI